MLNLFFDGAGWLFPFNFGVAQFIKDHYDINDINVEGLSAGSVTALFLLLELDFQKIFDYIFEHEHYKNFKNNPFKIKHLLDDVLEKFVPHDDEFCRRITKKLHIHLSKYESLGLKHHIVEEYSCRKECIAYIKASSHIPIMSGLCGFKVGDNIFYDGGIVTYRNNNKILVTLDENIKHNKKISPGIALPHLWVYFPPTKEVMQTLFNLGYLKAQKFFHNHSTEDDTKLIEQLNKIKTQYVHKSYITFLATFIITFTCFQIYLLND